MILLNASSLTSQLYADDGKLYFEISRHRYDSVQGLLTTALGAISDWADLWQLTLSISKCNWMQITNRKLNRDLAPFVLTLDGQVLKSHVK